MTWTIPSAGDIADRAAAVYEATPALTGIDARSEHSVAAANARVTGGALFEAYLYQAYLAQELMVDTAVDLLDRHARVWGVPRVQPAAASGYVSVAGLVAGVSVPAGTTMTTPAGQVLRVTATGALGSGLTAVLAVVAASSGVAGNVAAGVVCTLSAPIAGLSPQTATVTTDGITGGLDLEAVETWRGRILDRIRAPAMGGSAPDYQRWVQEVAPGAYVKAIKSYAGAGTVGVVVAMPGPRAPTTGELATIGAYLEDLRPVTATVVPVAATLHAINVRLVLNPDTTATRAAAVAGLQLALAQDAEIGATVYVSRLDNAVSSSSGEYSHERLAPTTDVTLGATEIAVLGTVLWGAP